jgi:hypothetical protein
MNLTYARLAHKSMRRRFQAEADEDLKVFDEAAGIEQDQQQDDMDHDEDLVITNDRGFKNEKCPYTLVPVSVARLRFGCARGAVCAMGSVAEAVAMSRNAIGAASTSRVTCCVAGHVQPSAPSKELHRGLWQAAKVCHMVQALI